MARKQGTDPRLARIEQARRRAAQGGQAVPELPPDFHPTSDVEAGLVEGLFDALAFERGALPSVRMTPRLVTARQATAATVAEYSPARIKKLRQAVHLSQPVFAQALNVDADTVRAWEQGKRTPSGAALRLLQLTEQHPEWLLAAVQPR